MTCQTRSRYFRRIAANFHCRFMLSGMKKLYATEREPMKGMHKHSFPNAPRRAQSAFRWKWALAYKTRRRPKRRGWQAVALQLFFPEKWLDKPPWAQGPNKLGKTRVLFPVTRETNGSSDPLRLLLSCRFLIESDILYIFLSFYFNLK